MHRQISQLSLLRTGAFIVDGLTISLALMLPASMVSYLIVWFFGSMRVITYVWNVALVLVFLTILGRDAFPGGSMGKRLLGLKLKRFDGRRCGYICSFVRNLPLFVPGWNLVEVYLLLFGDSPRTGDRIARTSVVEE